MKKNLLHFQPLLLAAGAVALISSCQDYEPFSDQHVQDVAYNHEFVKQFGEIDSRQNWDLFGQLARHIGPETRATMADEPYAEPSTRTKTISQDNYQNYTLFLPEINRGGNDFDHSNLGQVTQRFTTTARDIYFYPVNWVTTADDEIGIFWYVDEDDPNDPNIKVIMGQDDRLYYIKTLKVIDNHKSLLEIVYEFNDGSSLRKWIGDDRNKIGATASNGNRVSPLTYVYEGYQSNYQGNPDGTGRYEPNEFRDDVTANFFSDEEMSSRGINSQYLVAHAVHLHVPNNISEYGFYVKNNGNYYWWHDQKDPRYSKWELNTPEAIEENGKYKMSYTATFNIENLRPVLEGHGVIPQDDRNQYLCFEDWVQVGDADLNDVVYIAEGLDDTNIKDDDNITENAILVCEDLKSFDFDFNDIVLGLTYKEESKKTYTWIDHVTTIPGGYQIAPHWEIKDASATSETLTITPMAAGGWFETTVYIGEVSRGEIHTLLKEATTPPSPMKHEVINAGATYDDNRGVQPIGPTDIMSFFEGNWDVGEGKTYPTHLSQIFAQGYIRLECYDGTAKKLIQSNQYAQGNAPQMMLLPYYFEWPREEIHIGEAYSGFAEWVEDITKTNWILDTQDKDKITERGDFVIDDPQHEDNPVLVEGVELPVKPGKFVYGSGDPSTGGWTFNNAYFIDLTGVGLLVAEDAKADLVVHYNPKASGGYYIDDNYKNTLIHDPGQSDDGRPRTTTYTVSAQRLNSAITSGGLWIMNTDDNPFGISMVELQIYGVTDPNQRHDLDVTPPSLTFDQIGAEKQITVTSTTAPAGDIYFSSTDTNVATVDGTGKVTSVAEGHCQIIVTALASGGHTDNVQRVHVTVDRTPTIPLTVFDVINDEGYNLTNGGTTYYYICHRDLTTSEDLSGWTSGATITFHYEGYGGSTNPNFFRVLNPNGQVIAGDFTSHTNSADDVTYTISGQNLATCRDDTTGEYKFTIQYSQCQWSWSGLPNITSGSITKIAN